MTFLSFTSAEKRATVVLAVLLTVGGGVHVIKSWDGSALPGYRLVAREADTGSTPPQLATRKLDVGINPSTAPAEDLELLPGIGPQLASRIIQYRSEHGAYESPADLLRVQGIGLRTLARITPYLSFP